MFQQPAPWKTLSLHTLLGEATTGAPRTMVVFEDVHRVAALKSQKKNGLPSHADMKKILDQVRRMRSRFLKLAEDGHTNLRESLAAIYDGPLVSQNSIQRMSKETAVVLLVDLFNRVVILEERAMKLRPKTRHNSKTKEQTLLSTVMEVKEKVDEELRRMVNDAGSDKLLKGMGLSAAAKSMRFDPLRVPQDPDYQRCPFCGLRSLNLVPENKGMKRRNDEKITIYTLE
jgi:hypothetical protein